MKNQQITEPATGFFKPQDLDVGLESVTVLFVHTENPLHSYLVSVPRDIATFEWAQDTFHQLNQEYLEAYAWLDFTEFFVEFI